MVDRDRFASIVLAAFRIDRRKSVAYRTYLTVDRFQDGIGRVIQDQDPDYISVRIIRPLGSVDPGLDRSALEPEEDGDPEDLEGSMCPSCGYEIPEDRDVCPNCGYRFSLDLEKAGGLTE